MNLSSHMKIWKIRRISDCRSRMQLFPPALCEVDWIIFGFCFRDKIRNHKHFQCNVDHQGNTYSFGRSCKSMRKSQKTQIRRNGLSWSMHPAVWDLLDFWYFHVWAVNHFSQFSTDYAYFSKFLHDFYQKSTYFYENFYFEFYLKCSSVRNRINLLVGLGAITIRLLL